MGGNRAAHAPIIPGWTGAPDNCVSCPVYHEKCEHWGEVHHLGVKTEKRKTTHNPVDINI